MFSVINEVEIVANMQAAINTAVSARNCLGWTLSQLEDKPGTDQVYLVFSKPCATPIVDPGT